MQALLWKAVGANKVQCRLCAHFCILKAGQVGRCKVRVASQGKQELLTLVGDTLASYHVDPIEKKPLYHYLPGSTTFSIGTMGCNFTCPWCQNSSISCAPDPVFNEYGELQPLAGMAATAEGVVGAALQSECQSVAFTYNEPTIFFELMCSTADLALQAGLGTVMVSNGFQSPQCLEALKARIQAANIDLKAGSPATYRTLCDGRLNVVQDNIMRMHAYGWWLELTTLLIPGLNDSPEEMQAMARFIREKLGADVPWHLSAFFPSHRLRDRPATPLHTLQQAAAIGKEEGLNHIYVGNVAHSQATTCPNCKSVLITRQGFSAHSKMAGPLCPHCQSSIAGFWEATPPHRPF